MDSKRMNATLVAEKLVANRPKQIDLDRVFSHGPGGAKTMIDEGRNGDSLSLTIENSLDTKPQVVVAFGSLRNSQYADLASLLAAIGADCLIDDGEILKVADHGMVTVTSNDPGRKVGDVIRYAAVSPFRFTQASLESRLRDGSPDTSNYTTTMKSVWVSPFRKPTEDFLQLRQFQSNKSTSPQFADIDFLKENFKAMVSNEHFLVMIVKQNTALTMTLNVGAQHSSAQYAYRAFKAADETLSILR